MYTSMQIFPACMRIEPTRVMRQHHDHTATQHFRDKIKLKAKLVIKIAEPEIRLKSKLLYFILPINHIE